MSSSENNARARLLGTLHSDFPVSGAGVRVLLLDDGMTSQPDFGGRLRNLASFQGQPERSVEGKAHALRIASICAEGPEAAHLAGGCLGIAPAVELLSALYRPLIEPIQFGNFKHFFDSVIEKYGRVDVVGLPWSLPENHWLSHYGRSEFAELSDVNPPRAPLFIAATGHDGPGRVRFPSSCESVLGVGVCDNDLRPTHYCGVDPEVRKPELLVPSLKYLARLDDGQLGEIGGTSAAVAIATGLAALWCERLRSMGLAVTPQLLRAALLATSIPSAVSEHRILHAGAELRGEAAIVASELRTDESLSHKYIASRSGAGTIRVVACARAQQGVTSWIPTLPEVTLTVDTSKNGTRSEGRHWCLAEFEAQDGEEFQLTIDVRGTTEPVALFIAGASAAPTPETHVRKSVPAKRPAVIVGVSASHDASACLIRDGRLEVAIQLERLTRKRRDGAGYLRSKDAIEYCLKSAGLQVKDVDLFAFNAQPLLPGWVGLSQPCADEDFDLFDPFGERSVFVSHHLAHAFSAFFSSPFDSATVFIADGSGGSTLGAEDLILSGPELQRYIQIENYHRPKLHVQSTYLFEPHGFTLFDREEADSFNTRCGSTSLGEVYAAMSQYLFNEWQEGGKLMGLAPYGDAFVYGPSLLKRDDNGRLQFTAGWKNQFCKTNGEKSALAYRHLAARIQEDLEDALIDRIKRALALTKNAKLAYSGGIALNSVANERIWRETPIEKLFIFPASSDAGIAVGAAAAAAYQQTRSTARPVKHHSEFLGHPYGEQDYRIAIREYEHLLEVDEMDCAELAEKLVGGLVIGWFDGRAEFGPRALGHRSILADPRDDSMRRHINARVKYREDFRPLAPIVPADLASEYFEIDEPSPFMLRVMKVKEKYRGVLGAVCHVNQTARVQTIARDECPRLYELLMLFGDRVGLPILINTSMNVRGQPIVETPVQAIQMLLATEIDGLYMGSRLLSARRTSDSGLTLNSRIILPPCCRIVYEAGPGAPSAKLIAEARGKASYLIQPWCFNVLAHADGRLSVADLFKEHLPAGLSDVAALTWLVALYRQRLVLFTGEAEQPA